MPRIQNGSSARFRRRGRSWQPVWALLAVFVALLGVITALGDNDPAASASRIDARPATTSSSPQPTATATTSSSRAKVPDLVGQTLTEAKRLLTRAHLKVGNLTEKPSAKRAGTVLSQNVIDGAKITRGSQVDLIIAKAFPKAVSVVGKSEKSAVRTLKDQGFRVVVADETRSSGRAGVVLRQSPAAGSRLKPGTTIRVTVAKIVRPAAPKPTLAAPFAGGGGACTPGYSPCLPPASDYDCSGGSGNGPEYTGRVRVTGSDPYDLDRDGDGWGCE